MVREVETTEANHNTNQLSRGEQKLILGNHLGNNNVVINDVKKGVSTDGITINYYTANVVSATDYSAYGENLIGREFNGTVIKYGFNSKLNDEDIGYQDYGLRVYSTKAKHFPTIDPLTTVYPFYSPYQFAGNTPIQFIDLDGGEPKSKTSTNPEVRKLFVSPFGKYAGRLSFIHGPYWATGGDKDYFSRSETESKGYYENNIDANKFIGYKGQMNTNSQFYRYDESLSESEMVNNLLGDFVWGNGPENTVFKHNGKYSNLMKESVATGETLAKFSYDMEKGDPSGISKTYSWANDLRGEVNVNVASGPLSLAHFVGSCQLRVTSFSNTDEIMVEVFNVTSLTSGDFIKDITPDRLVSPLKSTVRNGDKSKSQVEYSNMSQYFSFTISRKDFNAKVKQYESSKTAYKQKQEAKQKKP
jgi:RHS repeat-associated protein